MKGKITGIIASILLVISLLVGLVACAQPAPTTPTTPTTPAQPKTLSIAANIAMNWPLGLDCLHMIEIDLDKVNKNGGLDIGGEKYIVNCIFDDNKMDMALTKTLGEKEIFQDNVKFILSDPFATPLFGLCEENKVVGIQVGYDPEVFSPKYNWMWNVGNSTCHHPGMLMYAAKRFPELKTMVGIFPDRYDGRLAGELFTHTAEVAGLQVLEMLYYPPAATDLSAIGTKIKQLNPDMIVPYGGGPPLDAGAMKAAYVGGWRGKVIGVATMPASTVMGIAGPEAVEGGIFLAWPAEFEPATTPAAQEWKDAYKAKFGKWDDPEVAIALAYWSLKAALQQGDSIDPQKVKAALDNGLKYDDTPVGSYQRISRPDQGNDRTVDCTGGNLPVKEISGGTFKQIDTISLEQYLEFMKQLYSSPW